MLAKLEKDRLAIAHLLRVSSIQCSCHSGEASVQGLNMRSMDSTV